MLVELRQAGSEALLDRLEMENAPQPGRWLEDSMLIQQTRQFELRICQRG